MSGGDLEQAMLAYAAGDLAGFDTLYAGLAPMLTAYYRRQGFAPEACADLVQQTFLRLHLARGRYVPGAPVKPWVFRIAANLGVDQQRRQTRARETAWDEQADQLPAPPVGPMVELAGLPEDVEGALHQALAALPEAQREALLLHKVGGLSMAEVARATGASVSAVKVRAFRAYEALRKALGGKA